MNDELAERLRQLDAAPRPSVERFDDGLPLAATAAVLPSAFNPPTHAHQHLLERAQSVFRLEGAIALLTTRNVDKTLHGATLADRVRMLLALREELAGLAVMASNQARIADQAIALRAACPGTVLNFVVGFDTLERLFAPRYYTDMERELTAFFEHHRLLAANRGETDVARVEDWLDAHARPFRDRIDVLEIDDAPATVSSTRVREALRYGDPLDVAPPVRRYIEVHGLYR